MFWLNLLQKACGSDLNKEEKYLWGVPEKLEEDLGLFTYPGGGWGGKIYLYNFMNW